MKNGIDLYVVILSLVVPHAPRRPLVLKIAFLGEATRCSIVRMNDQPNPIDGSYSPRVGVRTAFAATGGLFENGRLRLEFVGPLG